MHTAELHLNCPSHQQGRVRSYSLWQEMHYRQQANNSGLQQWSLLNYFYTSFEAHRKDLRGKPPNQLAPPPTMTGSFYVKLSYRRLLDQTTYLARCWPPTDICVKITCPKMVLRQQPKSWKGKENSGWLHFNSTVELSCITLVSNKTHQKFVVCVVFVQKLNFDLMWKTVYAKNKGVIQGVEPNPADTGLMQSNFLLHQLKYLLHHHVRGWHDREIISKWRNVPNLANILYARLENSCCWSFY